MLGLTGNLGESNPTTGNTLYGNDVVGAGIGYVAGQNFSFTGVQYTIDIISLTDDTTGVAGAVPFSFGRLSIVADQVSLEQAAPEPATGLLAIPLMLLPCIRALRRRRA